MKRQYMIEWQNNTSCFEGGGADHKAYHWTRARPSPVLQSSVMSKWTLEYRVHPNCFLLSAWNSGVKSDKIVYHCNQNEQMYKMNTEISSLKWHPYYIGRTLVIKASHCPVGRRYKDDVIEKIKKIFIKNQWIVNLSTFLVWCTFWSIFLRIHLQILDNIKI